MEAVELMQTKQNNAPIGWVLGENPDKIKSAVLEVELRSKLKDMFTNEFDYKIVLRAAGKDGVPSIPVVTLSRINNASATNDLKTSVDKSANQIVCSSNLPSMNPGLTVCTHACMYVCMHVCVCGLKNDVNINVRTRATRPDLQS